VNAIRIFNEKEVDEILVIDIDASRYSKEPDYSLIEKIAGECFMPIGYGGGIQNVQQARSIFSLGVEKICIQSEAIRNPMLIPELVSCFGSQSVVFSLDIKKSWSGKMRPYLSSERKSLGVRWQDLLAKVIKQGAGEILLNVVNKDGTLSGPDLKSIELISGESDVPVIALGGISSIEDIKACIQAGASAVAAGSFFVFHGPHRAVLISYPSSAQLNPIFGAIP
jgi:cyclase